jgi:tripartite-type tricarboxylate transporter receptor subunit TctC
MAVAQAPLALGRPIAAPAGVPDERVAALRAALAATFRDPDYLPECVALRLECDEPVAVPAITDALRQAYAASPAVVRALQQIYQAGEGR